MEWERGRNEKSNVGRRGQLQSTQVFKPPVSENVRNRETLTESVAQDMMGSKMAFLLDEDIFILATGLDLVSTCGMSLSLADLANPCTKLA